MLIEVIVIAVALPAKIIEAGKTEVVAVLAISILVVYILTHLIEWFQNYVVAKQMTKEPLSFQRNYE